MTRKILKLNHWLLTLIIIVILGCFITWGDKYSSYDVNTIIIYMHGASANLDRLILYLVSSIDLGVLFSFIYSYIASTNIYKVMPEKLKEVISISNFKRIVTVSFIIGLLLRGAILLESYILLTNGFSNIVAAFVKLILLLVLLGTIIATGNFSAKILVSYELNKLANFREYYRTAILYFIFPIGLPFIHKRVRYIVEKYI